MFNRISKTRFSLAALLIAAFVISIYLTQTSQASLNAGSQSVIQPIKWQQRHHA